MTPEQQARVIIDGLLKAAGWDIQDKSEINLHTSLGVAVREFPLTTGQVDYLLFVGGKVIGAIEAKKIGVTLSGIAEQSQKYIYGLPAHVRCWGGKIPPFAYESTGVETNFRDIREPDSRSRKVFCFHKPETLLEWAKNSDTLRGLLKAFPLLKKDGLRECQFEALSGLEQSLSDNRPKSLIQMATGSGKTFTAVAETYRLVRHAKAKRILFLVDRNNLGRQTLREFQQFTTEDDGRKFGEMYNIQLMTGNTIDPVSKVVITTIQKLYSMLKGEEIEEELEENSLFENEEDVDVKEVQYNPKIPIETFDVIITDECHRSIYNVWRHVLEYFDAFLIGLTATPSKQTLGFFNQNLVTEYSHDRAVADGVNVGYDIYRLKTRISEKGSTIEAKYYVDKRDKLTRKIRWEKLDEELAYNREELDKNVVAEDQIRTVVRGFKERLFTDLFPGRTEVPKTLIFAKDDSHAEDIVNIVREEFAKGNDFCKKITYRTTGEKPEDLIASFRNSYNPRIAVTVDMISTGTDIKPLECLIFMRQVKSQVYFEQMKGRGTRTVTPTELQAVTPDAKTKTHFVLVDAVGVVESDKSDSRPLERNPSISLEKLLVMVAQGARDTDTLTSIVGRLAKLDKRMDEKNHQEFIKISGGKHIRIVLNEILDAIDPDMQMDFARSHFNTPFPIAEQVSESEEILGDKACILFSNPNLRQFLVGIGKQNEQIIDIITKDEIIYAGYDFDKAKDIVDKFEKFINENKDENSSLKMLCDNNFAGILSFEDLKQVVESFQQPPYNLTVDLVWRSFNRLEKTHENLKDADESNITNIISAIRFCQGYDLKLQPFAISVDLKFMSWLEKKKSLELSFNEEQLFWLHMFKEHICTSLLIDREDLEYAPFNLNGGVFKATNLFGDKLDSLIEELNKELVS